MAVDLRPCMPRVAAIPASPRCSRAALACRSKRRRGGTRRHAKLAGARPRRRRGRSGRPRRHPPTSPGGSSPANAERGRDLGSRAGGEAFQAAVMSVTSQDREGLARTLRTFPGVGWRTKTPMPMASGGAASLSARTPIADAGWGAGVGIWRRRRDEGQLKPPRPIRWRGGSAWSACRTGGCERRQTVSAVERFEQPTTKRTERIQRWITDDEK